MLLVSVFAVSGINTNNMFKTNIYKDASDKKITIYGKLEYLQLY